MMLRSAVSRVAWVAGAPRSSHGLVCGAAALPSSHWRLLPRGSTQSASLFSRRPFQCTSPRTGGAAVHDQPASSKPPEGFYIVGREPGQERDGLPIWAAREPFQFKFTNSLPKPVERVDVPGVPGAFQLLNALTPEECDRLVQIVESLGFDTDAPVSLPHSVRHNCNVNWIVDEAIDGAIWDRIKPSFDKVHDAQALGLNARFRFYRYGPGDYFLPHTDGSWPGSRVRDGQLIRDAYGDRWSQMTVLILLSDNYEGGRTVFRVDGSEISTKTPKGGILVFPHGGHPQHCLHAGENVASGFKYMIRTEALYQRTPRAEVLQWRHMTNMMT